MSIRKILGASIWQIIQLFSKVLLFPVLLAFILALPLGYYLSEEWLSDFAYRISLEIDLFIYVFMGILLIACLTISYHAIRSSFVDPAQALKEE